MNEDRDRQASSSTEPRAASEPTGGSKDTSIGTGKKVGLYGMGFLLLGLIFVVVVAYFTGYYVPFEGTEGVGP